MKKYKIESHNFEPGSYLFIEINGIEFCSKTGPELIVSINEFFEAAEISKIAELSGPAEITIYSKGRGLHDFERGLVSAYELIDELMRTK